MDKSTLKQLIRDYLNVRFQLTLATCGAHPWICTLYYSCDPHLNLYVLTDPTTIHAQQMVKNSAVAVSIADSPQNPSSKKVGIQLWGQAEQIKGKAKIIHALTLWRAALRVTDPNYSYEGMVQKLISGKMYVIRPKQIKFFNESLWDEGKEQVLTIA